MIQALQWLLTSLVFEAFPFIHRTVRARLSCSKFVQAVFTKYLSTACYLSQVLGHKCTDQTEKIIRRKLHKRTVMATQLLSHSCIYIYSQYLMKVRWHHAVLYIQFVDVTSSLTSCLSFQTYVSTYYEIQHVYSNQ